jgi:hypothetical protein
VSCPALWCRVRAAGREAGSLDDLSTTRDGEIGRSANESETNDGDRVSRGQFLVDFSSDPVAISGPTKAPLVPSRFRDMSRIIVDRINRIAIRLPIVICLSNCWIGLEIRLFSS